VPNEEIVNIVPALFYAPAARLVFRFLNRVTAVALLEILDAWRIHHCESLQTCAPS
jgi:hypothetical protein